ncbi:MAG: hypothetical protein PF961_12295 [Planctomycetota bacterium]|nr:hypothetical protein [Planctomycetota bacterium]
MGPEIIVVTDVLAKSSLQGIDRERNDPSSDLASGGADEPFNEGVAAWTLRWRALDLASDRAKALPGGLRNSGSLSMMTAVAPSKKSSWKAVAWLQTLATQLPSACSVTPSTRTSLVATRIAQSVDGGVKPGHFNPRIAVVVAE